MPALDALVASFGGELFTPDRPGYDAIRRPVNVAYHDRYPVLVLNCRSVSDVVAAVTYAGVTGDRVALRGGGQCFAGRSSTDRLLLDLSGLDEIRVADDGMATIGAGARLGQMYPALHAAGRTLPAGCGATVGIAGLTLGGGIGLLGRKYALTCDRLVGAQVVLSDGTVVVCDRDRDPDLFWGLRGAGGGQFGVVASLRFDTVAEPLTTRIEVHLPDVDIGQLVAGWQAWAPDAPDELTVNLIVVAEPGTPVHAALLGACALDEGLTRGLLQEFAARSGGWRVPELGDGVPYHQLKSTFRDPDVPGRARLRSEFFSRPLTDATLETLLALLADPSSHPRRLTFTAMGGAYNRIAEDATAFAHRNERFLLEHAGETIDPWVDGSWTAAHADGSGHVYPNFPDPALTQWATAYHGTNYARLVAVKNAYDPDRFFDFPQAIPSTERTTR